MVSVALQTQKSPLQVFGLVVLLSVAVAGYLFFNTWHNAANANNAEQETRLNSQDFLMFMHSQPNTKQFFSGPVASSTVKHFSHSNKKFTFLESNHYERPF